MGCDLIGTVLLQSPLSGFGVETDLLADVKSLKGFVPGQEMPFEFCDIPNMIALDGGLSRALLRFGHMDRERPAILDKMQVLRRENIPELADDPASGVTPLRTVHERD
jgi:hypothetical protein